MSADNGVYILVTPKGDGKEYRIAHLMAVENFAYGSDTDEDVWIKNARGMWGESVVYTDRDKAFLAARDEHDRVEYSEYGISEIEINREF